MEAQIRGPGLGDKRYFRMKASAARAAGDAVYIDYDQTGPVDLTIASNAAVHFVAVATNAIASGSYGLYQVCGECTLTVPSATYAANDALGVTTGAIAVIAAFPAAGLAGQAQTNFCVVKVGGTSVTSVTVDLHGTAFTSS